MQSILELRHLKTLQALQQAGSVSRAATLLNLTQSALSHQLKLLEDHYGAALFERKSVPLAFTATGERLLQLAAQVLPEVAAAERGPPSRVISPKYSPAWIVASSLPSRLIVADPDTITANSLPMVPSRANTVSRSWTSSRS